MGVDAAIRVAVMNAWARKCFYCGREAAEVDHIVPLKKQGKSEPHNLVACCTDCNRAKGNLWLPRDVLEEALHAAQKLVPFVLQAADIHRASLQAAMDKVNYGSSPLREGTQGRSLMQRGERMRRPARILGAEASEIARRFSAQNVET